MTESLPSWLRPAKNPILLDWVCLVTALLSTPALRTFGYIVKGKRPPDTFAYLTMSERILSDGLLYIPGWEHVDQGLVLSPLFPLLIAMARPFASDGFHALALVNSLAVLSSVAIAYRVLRHYLPSLPSMIAVIGLAQLYPIHSLALHTLSEGVFVATSLLSVWMLLRLLDRPTAWRGVALGLALASATLARKPGLLVAIFAFGWLVLVAWRGRDTLPGPRTALGSVTGGFLVLFAPYALALQLQVGATPIQQTISLDRYHVCTDDPVILAEIESLSTGPVKSWKTRRALTQLLPDASEMYKSVGRGCQVTRPARGFHAFRLLGESPLLHVHNILSNFGHLGRAVSPLMLTLFLVTAASAAWRSMHAGSWPRDLALPALVLFSTVALSLVAGSTIERYMHPLIALVYLSLAHEVYVLSERIPHRLKGKGIVAVVVLAGFGAWTDQRNLPVRPAPSAFEKSCDIGGEGVFSLDKGSSYAVGGIHRTLPDADFEQFREYARRTGTRWLAIAHNRRAQKEIQARKRVAWLVSRQLELDYPGLLEPECDFFDGRGRLYRLIGSE